jgi:hypothetical protein
MFEDAIIDSNCLHPFNHCNISVMCFPNFKQNTAEMPNSRGMGHAHAPKILKKIPEGGH